MGDIYWYRSGVNESHAGGGFDSITYNGPLAFDTYQHLPHSDEWLGSSGYIQQQPMEI